MTQHISFTYPQRGPGRPQILLIGNGLEYKSGQCSWDQLVDKLALPEKDGFSAAKSLPFPLRYELLATPSNVSNPLGRMDILQEEKRLAEAMKTMIHKSNSLLEELPKLHMDHIFTTNYSYCLEQAFFPKHNFEKEKTRSKFRFDLREESQREGQKREVQYRLHTGYRYEDPTRPQGTGLWHIHGESSPSVPTLLVRSPGLAFVHHYQAVSKGSSTTVTGKLGICNRKKIIVSISKN